MMRPELLQRAVVMRTVSVQGPPSSLAETHAPAGTGVLLPPRATRPPVTTTGYRLNWPLQSLAEGGDTQRHQTRSPSCSACCGDNWGRQVATFFSEASWGLSWYSKYNIGSCIESLLQHVLLLTH